MKFKKLSIVYLIFVLLLSFSLSAKGYELREVDKLNIQTFQKTLRNYERNFFQNNEMDSSDFSKYTHTYAQLIELYISLGEKYADVRFSEMAFTYLEKFKNQTMLNIFLQAVSSDSAKNSLKNILNQNYKLAEDFFKVQNDLLFNERDKNKAINEKNKTNKSMKDLLDSVKMVNSQFSFYCLLQKPLVPSYLQKSCLKGNEAILDFWIHNDKITIFTVTADTVIVARLPVSAERIKEKITKLTAPIFFNHDLLHLEFDYQLSFQLYRQLFKPLEKYLKQVKTINIIPDNFLMNFPFELLVTDTTQMKHLNRDVLYEAFKGLKYLIHKYAIFYNYSAIALCPETANIRSRNKIGRKLLTMSDPVVEDKDLPPCSEISALSLLNLESSDYSADEIKRVSRLLWHHHNLKGTDVTKEYLFKNGRNYRWIYLAQLGVLNNTNPLASGLVFSNKNNNTNYSFSWLSCSDVVQSFLRADMITLSSVKLTPIFTKQNYGIIALPQAFIFSGVRSVVHSLWDINSISTSQFMSKFYWELKYKRQTNVRALQEAKVASMKDSFKFSGKEVSRAHPFFWAGFRLIGNPRVTSPSNAPIPPWGIVIIIYFIVIIFGLIIAKKTLLAKNIVSDSKNQ